MASEQLVQAESRERSRMAVLAGLAALFTLAAPVIGLIVLKDAPDNVPGSALFRSRHELGLSLSSACSVLGVIAIAFVLDFLYRATRARNERMPAGLRPLPFAGALGLAVLSVALQVVTVVKLNHFASHGSQTYDEAQAATDYGALVYLGLIAQLAFAFAIVMISVNAMRVGLLTRFLGYLGVISAVLFILSFFPLSVVQIYWLGALAALFAGRSPSGVPPAWERGEAVPWPSTQELREQRIRDAEARRGSEPGVAGADEPREEVASPGPSPAASRRKRKKRR